MAVQTSLFSDDDREAMRAAERALAADLERLDGEVSDFWRRAITTDTTAEGPLTFDQFHRTVRAATARPGAGALAADCPVCHAHAGEPCGQTCETNRAP